MGNLNVFTSGMWRKGKAVHVFTNGVWRIAKTVWVFTGGSWKPMGFSSELQIKSGIFRNQESNYVQFGLCMPRPAVGFPGCGVVLSQSNPIPELGGVTEMYLLNHSVGRSFNINTTTVPGLRWLKCTFRSSKGTTASAVVRANYSTQIDDAVFNIFNESEGDVITVNYELTDKP